VKTQIIHLDPQDDYFSARDKLSWVKAPRVLLVWPSRGTVLNRRLDLVLVQRACRRRGIQPGLVTFDPDVTSNAAELNIPVFHSLQEAPEAQWAQPAADADGKEDGILHSRRADSSRPASLRRDSQSPTKSARWGWFGVTLIALIVLLFALIPSAEIRLPLDTTPHQIEVSLPLTVDNSNPDAQTLPARTEHVVVSGRDVVPVSGMVETPAEHARGEVLFTNRTAASVFLPAGTGIRPASTSELRFETTEPVTLAAGPGTTALVPVLASMPGSEGNLPAETLTAIEGNVAFSLDAVNPDPLTGGTNQLRPGVSALDLEFARDVALETLMSTAREALLSRLAPDEQLLFNGLSLSNVLVEEYDHEVGMPTDYLGITVEAEFEAVIISQNNLDEIIRQQVESALGPDDALAVIEDVQWQDGDSTAESIQLDVSYRTRSAVHTVELRTALRGRTKAAAQAYLMRQFNLASAPDIRLFPTWLPRLPFLDARIRIEWSGGTP